jgi:uncharacterized protein (TIGR00725 family)
MSRRLNLSVLGSYAANEVEHKLASELGLGIADMGLNIISGGQEGVMYSLCKAVHEHRVNGYDSAYIVGILPFGNFAEANRYLDLAIPAGAPHLQNAMIPLAADIVVSVGGAAGTLSELAMAWQFKKPIALLGTEGWSGKLAGQKLDTRREDPLEHFHKVADLLVWIASTKLAIENPDDI